MSLALGHFAFGAAATTLLLLSLPPTRYLRTVVLCGGGWAMLPDLHWVSPVGREAIVRFHQTSALTDLFWFHGTLDRLDPGDSPRVAAALLALLVVLTLVAERRTPRPSAVLERPRETHPESGPE